MPRDTKINKIDIKSYPLPCEPHEDIPKIQRKLLSPKEINCPTSPMTTICVEDKRTLQTESKMQSASTTRNATALNLNHSKSVKTKSESKRRIKIK